MIVLMGESLPASAGNTLTAVLSSSNSFEVMLLNNEKVSGVQFRLQSSAGIVLESVRSGNRTAGGAWIVDSYRVNDTALNVLILNRNSQSISAGHGPILTVLFKYETPRDEHSIELKNAMVIDEYGDSLGLAITNLVWTGSVSGPGKKDREKSFVLGQNYPNPFNPSTMLTYRLNKAARVRLSVFDMTGREVIRLVDRFQNEGSYNVPWNSKLTTEQQLASGMYIARLNVENEFISRKILLTK